ncbi:MAG: class II aldolase/adducin family protein [Capsulimonadales bacterium]|nr:class II aldolase/adducin family protein [Capsulimonadales bacterium]
MNETDVLDRLHALAHWLGDPARDLAILAEGNVSAAMNEEKTTFWLKASGCSLGSMRRDQFVRMDVRRSLAILEQEILTDAEIKSLLTAARSNPEDSLYPSVEAALHAVCLTDGGANVVGHTHPTPWLSILCSQKAEEAVAGRIFPDEIVVCGIAPCFVPYIDPGPPLARAAREAIHRHVGEYGEPPKVLLLKNHGLFALGKDADEVERVTAMSVKVARAILGTYALGGPHFLTERQADRIKTRPDEHFRQKMLAEMRGR